MNYIGSKKTLLPFISKTIETNSERIENKIFCDLFSGSGVVGSYFKNKVKKVLMNDLEYYSYVLSRNYVQNIGIFEIPFTPKKNEGFIYKNYCLGSGSGRNYFSDENGKYIDGIRKQIEYFRSDKDLYYFLMCSLLEAADKVANTASVYGAFLKKIKKTAERPLQLIPKQPVEGEKGLAFQENANDLLRKIKGDILYLDPPYNTRQYGSNYHILNTIAKYQLFFPSGKTGLPVYNKSKYSSRVNAKEVFEDLIANADFEDIYISYNNEGIIDINAFESILKQYGSYNLFIFDGYRRFKADSSRVYSNQKTVEYLHCLKKSS